VVGEDGTAYTNQVSAREACQALETLANLLFLTAQYADDGVLVRRFTGEAGSCITKLAQFIRPQLAASNDMQSPNRV
jgi:hypothetical protein